MYEHTCIHMSWYGISGMYVYLRERPCLPDLSPGELPLPEAGAGLDFALAFEPEWEDS